MAFGNSMTTTRIMAPSLRPGLQGKNSAKSGSSFSVWGPFSSMRRHVRKYWHVINIGIQNTLVYRVNFLFRSIFALIPLFATISLWRAIYEGKGGTTVAGYTLAQMISYYLVVTIVDALTGV